MAVMSEHKENDLITKQSGNLIEGMHFLKIFFKKCASLLR